jgi:hypothetical protein
MTPSINRIEKSKMGTYERSCLCHFVSLHRRADAARMPKLSMAAEMNGGLLHMIITLED